MERSLIDLFIDMVVDRLIFKKMKLRSTPVLPSYTKQVWDYLKQGLVFNVLFTWYVIRTAEAQSYKFFISPPVYSMYYQDSFERR